MPRPLEVNIRKLLVSGMLCTTDDGRPVILISDDQSDEEKAISIWHEVVHLLRMAGEGNQCEEEVEAAALKLAEVCPEVIKWVGEKC